MSELEAKVAKIKKAIEAAKDNNMPQSQIEDLENGLGKLEAKLATEKNEASLIAEKKAEKKAVKAKKPENVSGKAIFGFFASQEAKLELNFPFHEKISSTEFDEIVNELASLAKEYFGVEADYSGIASKWLNDQNSTAKQLQKLRAKEAELEGRLAPEIDEATAENDCAEVRKKKASKPSKPAPKKQFGTRLKDTAVSSIKRALAVRTKAEGGKSEIDDKDWTAIQADLDEVVSTSKAMIKALKKLGKDKAASGVIEKFEKEVAILMEEFKPSMKIDKKEAKELLKLIQSDVQIENESAFSLMVDYMKLHNKPFSEKEGKALLKKVGPANVLDALIILATK